MRCQGLFGRLFGHKYRPRYSGATSYPADLSAILAATDDLWKENVLREMRMNTSQQYHGDVCIRCGHVVKESQP